MCVCVRILELGVKQQQPNELGETTYVTSILLTLPLLDCYYLQQGLTTKLER